MQKNEKVFWALERKKKVLKESKNFMVLVHLTLLIFFFLLFFFFPFLFLVSFQEPKKIRIPFRESTVMHLLNEFFSPLTWVEEEGRKRYQIKSSGCGILLSLTQVCLLHVVIPAMSNFQMQICSNGNGIRSRRIEVDWQWSCRWYGEIPLFQNWHWCNLW